MLRLLALALLCLPLYSPAARAHARDHNFLILLADDLGIDLVGAYGLHLDTPPTPTLDLLAKQGSLFRNAWAYSRCSPTRASLQSGRFGFHTGIGSNVLDLPGQFALPPSETLLPELFNPTHATASFGKWHLQSDLVGGILAPNLAGYEHYSGVPGLIRDESEYFSFQNVTNGVLTQVDEYIVTHVVDEVLAWVGEQSEPWFCSVNFHTPHAPTHTPPAHLHSFPLPLPDERTKYKAAVEALDSEIHRLLVGLGPELANTTVILMGDNGSEPFLSPPPITEANGKGTLHEPGIRVPLIVRSPFVAVPGRETLGVTCLADVWATVAAIGAVDVSGIPSDSISFLPHLDGSVLAGAPVREFAFSERFTPNGLGRPAEAHRAIRGDRFKLIRRPTGDEFYNLAADPLEKNNLLNQPLPPALMAQYLLLVSELEALLSS
jgi:arylsulfatase B